MKNLKRVSGFLLCMVMLLSNISGVSFAAEAGGLCEHHTEHLGCGYVEAESACDYVCEICAQGEEETTEPEAAEEPDKPGAQTRVDALETGTGVQAAPDVDLLDNEELFACFAERELYGYGISTYGVAASENLNSAEQAIYNILKAKVEAVAVNGGSTVFEISEIDGLKTVWTNAELGVTSIDDVAMVEAAFINQFNLSDLMMALVNDCPFDLYWYDKISGVNMSYQVDLSGYDDGMQMVWDSASIVKLTFTFAVSSDYRSGEYTVTTDVAGITTAKNNAAQVVADNAGKSDYEKLLAYKNYICETVSYDQAAASDSTTPYGDPWQLISVFDGDSATNVVCEGYAKAFQYLCDLTTFQDETACYMVSGQMEAEQHMWNVVTFGGSNYLVDVTNSDAGTAGQDGSLFLAGGNGSIAAGYTVAECQYIYDAETVSCWGEDTDSILAISNQNYNADGDGEEADDPIASGTCGENLTWTLDDAGTLTISGTGAMSDYSYSSVPWYAYRNQIKEVVIKDGVTSIGTWAFSDCSSLTEITIPDSVTSIGKYAFYGCSSLTDVYITDPSAWCKVEFEGSYSYPTNYADSIHVLDEEGNEVTEITLNETVTKIPGYAFRGGTFTSIEIPDSVTSIGYQAFYNCSNLAEITIPDSVTSIGSYAFEDCNSLTSVTIGDGVTSIDSWAFYGCSSLTEITIPDSVTSIGTWAFNGCSSLTEITIPDSVTSIGEDAFYGCSSLTEITIPDSVTSIGGSAFEDCSSLTSVTIGDGVTSIGSWAFSVCSSLTDVYITDPSAWCKVEFEGFYSNPMYYYADSIHVLDEEGNEVTEITLNETVTKIPDYAFRGGTFTSIEIPDSVTSIGYRAFYGCSSLTDIYFGGTSKEWTSLGNYRPVADYIHYSCTDGDIHWREVSEALSCTQDALTYENCGCGYKKNVIVKEPAPGHSHEAIVTPPTCTKAGYTTYTCSVCGDSYKDDYVAFLGHTYSCEVKAPTCTEAGYTTYTCSACGDSYRSNFTEPSHKEKILPAKDATCYDDGLTEGKQCSVCGEILVAQEEIPAPGRHTFNSDQDPFCALCGAVRSVPMFRMYDPNSGEHFYTGSVEEREILVKAGWNYEGVGFNFPVVGDPVHRLYEPATGEHLYTMDEAEMERLLSSGWNYEGVAFNSAPSTEIAQYRLHNPNGTRGAYHFTGDIGERDWLISLGWKYQGIGWYSCLR